MKIFRNILLGYHEEEAFRTNEALAAENPAVTPLALGEWLDYIH